jgi:branched-chain amino acid transport system substrate-binding protein
MSAKLLLACAALAAALLAGVPGALARPAAGTAGMAEPGITAKTILLGGTSPLSGPASAYASVARGADAYFRYANARGGVNGRTVSYKYVDDAYNPVQTVQATKQLVEQDQVFAVFNSLGTASNIAVRDYLNQLKVPQLFVASGATTFGRDYEQYPWTIGFQPSYQSEGRIYGIYLARTKPDARIAVLFQNDDYGKDLLAGLRRGIARSKVKLVAAQVYEATDADVQSQVAKLKASGANTLALFATPKFATQAYTSADKLGWRPLVIVNAVASASNVMAAAATQAARSVEGSISLVYFKDPLDPRWRSDSGIRLYRSVMTRYARGANARDVYHVYGMAVAYETVRLLEASGRNLTRAGLMAQARKLNDSSNPFLLPGIQVQTGATDRFPVEQALLQRWSKGSWKSFGGLWGFRAG